MNKKEIDWSIHNKICKNISTLYITLDKIIVHLKKIDSSDIYDECVSLIDDDMQKLNAMWSFFDRKDEIPVKVELKDL